MLALAVAPVFLALAVWGGLAWWFWDDWLGYLNELLTAYVPQDWLTGGVLEWVARYLGAALLLFGLAPIALASALVVASVAAMPFMLEHVSQNRYPGLEKRHGGTLAGSLWNGLAATAAFIVLWVLTLPLWLVPPLALVVPVLLVAQLNQRLFRYDALADHASAEEYREIVGRNRGTLFLLGIAVGVLEWVPVVNLIAPVYAGLVFIHFCLDELARLRARA
ncbi:MAG: EI24 domain-containing protein [Betaproteobacteria bacterium]|nr:EI24 domain-containing protein [Betaproteobacteria bacterium]